MNRARKIGLALHSWWFGWVRRVRDVERVRRNSRASRASAKDDARGEACSGAWRRAQQKAFAVLFDLRFGRRVEIGEDVRPGTRMAERGDAVLQLLLQHQGENTGPAGREWFRKLSGEWGAVANAFFGWTCASTEIFVKKHGFERRRDRAVVVRRIHQTCLLRLRAIK